MKGETKAEGVMLRKQVKEMNDLYQRGTSLERKAQALLFKLKRVKRYHIALVAKIEKRLAG